MRYKYVTTKKQKNTQPKPPSHVAPGNDAAEREAPEQIYSQQRVRVAEYDKKPPERFRLKEGWSNWLTLIFTSLLVLITSVYTYYSAKQWRAMQTSLEESKVTREIENRAYVSIKSANLIKELRSGEPASVNIFIENSGRTPARNVVMRLDFASRESSAPEPEPMKAGLPVETRGRPYSRTVIPPGTTLNTTVTSQTILADEHVNAVNQDRIRLYVWGVLEYDDRFGHHWSHFCGALKPRTRAFDNCANGNDIDD